MKEEVLVSSFQVGDFLVIITSFNLVFSGECVSWSHVNPSFHPPFDVIFL